MSEGGEKTEEPTPKKIRDARKKGQVAKSKEIPSAATITFVFLIIWALWDSFLKNLKELIILPTLYYNAPFNEGLKNMLSAFIIKIVIISFPIILGALLVSILSNYFQVGALFTFETVKPDIKKINPGENIKKVFGTNNLIEFVKNII
ncbi:MAG: EscU/YscU/HrcU family type III secretion system export apparatus switch protein, partial [Desulfobacterales bacterium]|nr:EscU/YscU/HrcU family type III secretion system export apparatus switch protein [Desulfobacterales bacterium]